MTPARLLTFVFFALMTACGNDSTEKSPSTRTDADAQGPSDIRQIWKIKSEFCDGIVVTPSGNETYYKFDPSHLVRVDTISHTEKSECRSAFNYDRVISMSSSDSLGYHESGLLKSAMMKTQCWNLKDGVRVEPPVYTETKPHDLAQQFGYTLNSAGRSLTLELDGWDSCQGKRTLILKR